MAAAGELAGRIGQTAGLLVRRFENASCVLFSAAEAADR